MATETKAGGYKELAFLKDARAYTSVAESKTETLFREVGRIQESVGRPDFTFFKMTLAEVLVYLAKASRAQDDIWNMRAQLGHVADDDVLTRLAAVEQKLAEIVERGRVS